MKVKIKAVLPKDHGLAAPNEVSPVGIVAVLRPVSTLRPLKGEPVVTYEIDRIEILEGHEAARLTQEAKDARQGRLSLPLLPDEQ